MKRRQPDEKREWKMHTKITEVVHESASAQSDATPWLGVSTSYATNKAGGRMPQTVQGRLEETRTYICQLPIAAR